MISTALALLLCANPATPSPDTVVTRLAEAMNAHDLPRLLDLFAADYESTQPAHPERNFKGVEGVKKNWGGLFADVPNLEVEVLSKAVSGSTVWSEWRWSGRRLDGNPVGMSGVITLDIVAGKIARARVFMESTSPPPASPALTAKLSEVLKRPPAFDYPGIMRIWVVHEAAQATSRVLEINGTINLHRHPRTDHRVVVLSGRLKVRVGDTEQLLEPGDFVFIPRGVTHKMWLPAGEKQARCLLIDAPGFDPGSTEWLEPAPSAPHLDAGAARR